MAACSSAMAGCDCQQLVAALVSFRIWIACLAVCVTEMPPDCWHLCVCSSRRHSRAMSLLRAESGDGGDEYPNFSTMSADDVLALRDIPFPGSRRPSQLADYARSSALDGCGETAATNQAAGGAPDHPAVSPAAWGPALAAAHFDSVVQPSVDSPDALASAPQTASVTVHSRIEKLDSPFSQTSPSGLDPKPSVELSPATRPRMYNPFSFVSAPVDAYSSYAVFADDGDTGSGGGDSGGGECSSQQAPHTTATVPAPAHHPTPRPSHPPSTTRDLLQSAESIASGASDWVADAEAEARQHSLTASPDCSGTSSARCHTNEASDLLHALIPNHRT